MKVRTRGAASRHWRRATVLMFLGLTVGCGAVVPGASADRSAGLALANSDPCSYFTPQLAAEYLGQEPPRLKTSPSSCSYKRGTQNIGFSVDSYDPRRQSEAEMLAAMKAGRLGIVEKCPDVPESSLPPGMSAYDWDESQGLDCVIGSVSYVEDGRIVTLQGQFPASRLIATMRQIIGR